MIAMKALIYGGGAVGLGIASCLLKADQEVFLVMKAGDYSTYWHAPEEYIALFYHELIPRTAQHPASTLQDLQGGKRTEIDALNGAIVALGKKYKVLVPANEIVYHMIKFMETPSLWRA